MPISSIPECKASWQRIWMAGLVSPSTSTIGSISFWMTLVAGYWRVPRPAAVITTFRNAVMRSGPRGTFRPFALPQSLPQKLLFPHPRILAYIYIRELLSASRNHHLSLLGVGRARLVGD